MQTSVNLQNLYKYSITPLLIIIFLFIAETLLYIYLQYVKKNVKTTQVPIISEKNIKNLPVIKNKYLNQLDSIENRYKNNIITLRKAYQEISENMRLFVFEVTDISTQNYTLSEIKKIDIPVLYELIEEYYEPEFARKSVGDFESSIEKAKGVINKWN